MSLNNIDNNKNKNNISILTKDKQPLWTINKEMFEIIRDVYMSVLKLFYNSPYPTSFSFMSYCIPINLMFVPHVSQKAY